MRKRRSTFRARRPTKMVNAHIIGRRNLASTWTTAMLMKERQELRAITGADQRRHAVIVSDDQPAAKPARKPRAKKVAA